MNQEVEEKIIEKVGRPLLRPLGLLQGVALLIFFASPFVWVWGGWSEAWRIGLTGIFGIIIFNLLYNTVKKVVKEEIKEELTKTYRTTKRSSFQQRLDEALNNQRKDKV
jgi:Na+/melibiose symporter-like transporter